ncbi:unnamed protein product [Ostreobium quekettii]|uniref:tRNA(Phe) (4-demethylwyosine(37)-C(7)) aminocarboxypropyltransferase n=1 Tax=Ostreobium quekettii TaxID=121088 RepID=A0A8S1IXN1_9CHLO|nr:unnamed protein product [Ostreobium quekettii]
MALPDALIQTLTSGGYITRLALHKHSKRSSSPADVLKRDLQNLLATRDLNPSEITALLEEVPTGWEKLGDLIMLPQGSMCSSMWADCGHEAWKIVASAIGGRRVARQAHIASAETRDSQAEMLHGENGWVEHRENGIMYSFDVTTCMFSSGNGTERARMGAVCCQGETVVDCYAGIGYFTLPILCHGKAQQVYACEWNPPAAAALRHNLNQNGVASRCVVHEGDCRNLAPKGVADRVVMGLLPSSQAGWATAVEALKPEGANHRLDDSVAGIFMSQAALFVHRQDSGLIRSSSANRMLLFTLSACSVLLQKSGKHFRVFSSWLAAQERRICLCRCLVTEVQGKRAYHIQWAHFSWRVAFSFFWQTGHLWMQETPSIILIRTESNLHVEHLPKLWNNKAFAWGPAVTTDFVHPVVRRMGACSCQR